MIAGDTISVGTEMVAGTTIRSGTLIVEGAMVVAGAVILAGRGRVEADKIASIGTGATRTDGERTKTYETLTRRRQEDPESGLKQQRLQAEPRELQATLLAEERPSLRRKVALATETADHGRPPNRG